MSNVSRSGRLALVVGGGPAPGINGVISAVTIEAINQGMDVLGCRDGFQWLAQGDGDHCPLLTIPDVKAIHLRGGSILGTSRVNPTKSEEQMRNVLDVFRHKEVTALVTIGGDDTAYSGSQVYARAGGHPRGPRAQDHRQRPAAAQRRARRSALRRPGMSASASSATWPRTPGPRCAGT